MIKEITIAVLSCLFGMLWIIAATPYFITEKHIDISVKDISEVEQIIQSVHSAHNYTENYVCHNYTVDAVVKLNASGYDAYYVYGKYMNATKSHAWVKVCSFGTYCTDYDVTKGLSKPLYSLFSEIRTCTISHDIVDCGGMKFR